MKKNKTINKRYFKINFDFKLKIFLLLFIIIISILIGLIINLSKPEKLTIYKYKSADFSFSYDNNFKIMSTKDGVLLYSKDKSSVIDINKIKDNYMIKNMNQSEIAATLAFETIKDSDNYIEVYNDREEMENYNRYYYLYENYQKEKQIEIIVTFKNNDIYTVVYQSNSAEFDLYSESVSIILDSMVNR